VVTNLNADLELTDVPANVVAVDWRSTPETLYVGTDVGVFWSYDRGTTWINSSSGLPSAVVMDLRIEAAANRLVAATHGREPGRRDGGRLPRDELDVQPAVGDADRSDGPERRDDGNDQRHDRGRHRDEHVRVHRARHARDRGASRPRRAPQARS